MDIFGRLFNVCGALLCLVALAACSTDRAAGTKPAARPPAPVSSPEVPLSMVESSLRTELAATAAVIDSGNEALLLRYPVRLAFAADQNALRPAFTALLERLLHVLHTHDRVAVTVAVYTDAIGAESFNDAQSLQRGAAIATWLRERGIAARRLSVRAGGESAPLKAENSPEGRELNRRVEIAFSILSS
jgi:outer membrane protein OmpA-like peptidoglycan-associated protein